MADEKFTLAKAKIIAEKLEQRIDGLDGRVSKVETDVTSIKTDSDCTNDKIDEIRLTLYGNKTANFNGLVESVKSIDSKMESVEQNLSKKIDDLMASKVDNDARNRLIIKIVDFVGFPGGIALMYALLHYLGVK